MDEEMDLSSGEKEAFRKLPRSISIDSKLEDKVVNKLMMNNLIKKKMKTKSYITGIAASVIFFIAGFLLANKIQNPGINDLPSDYMLLLLEDDNFKPTKELPELVAEYENWLVSQSDAGVKITGAELGYPEVETDYPLVSGFFMIAASSMEEAREIAANCPHKKYGGIVEVREVIKH
jgi:hypothetical protein